VIAILVAVETAGLVDSVSTGTLQLAWYAAE
jgi:hypothetical protein